VGQHGIGRSLAGDALNSYFRIQTGADQVENEGSLRVRLVFIGLKIDGIALKTAMT
jgi:hypothetical protein